MKFGYFSKKPTIPRITIPNYRISKTLLKTIQKRFQL